MAITTIEWSVGRTGNAGPCIHVHFGNPLKQRGAIAEPPVIRALLDTGATLSVVSRTFARHCGLFQVDGASEFRTLGSTQSCDEYVASISFPGTELRSFPTLRVVAADFVQEPNFACLIGRDIIRHWRITFDGPRGVILIED